MLEFVQVVPGAKVTRADASADGTMPTRAFRYCEAMRLAAGAGFYVHAPQDFDLVWDGETILLRAWAGGEGTNLTPLQPSAWLPGVAEAWDDMLPALAGMAPPSVAALREPGLVQIWTGLFVRAPADMRLWFRSPANVPPVPGLAFFDGVVSAASLRPVFTNARITRTGEPLAVRAERPLLQIVPLPAGSFAKPMPWSEDAPFAVEEIRASFQAPGDDKPAGTYARAERRALGEVAA